MKEHSDFSLPGVNKSHHVVNVKLELISVFKLWPENEVGHYTSRIVTNSFQKLAVLKSFLSVEIVFNLDGVNVFFV